MLRIALMFRLVLIGTSISVILYYLNAPSIYITSALLFLAIFLFGLLMSIVIEVIPLIAFHRGTPILGVITKTSKGLKLFGYYECVVHVTYTDGSHVLTTVKINTHQEDDSIYPIGTFCVLYKFNGELYLNKKHYEVFKYYEDADMMLLEHLINESRR